jgi:hypothetical protein
MGKSKFHEKQTKSRVDMGGARSMALKKPSQNEKFKLHNALRNIEDLRLQPAARAAIYVASPYHCGEDGKGLAKRRKLATPCPRRWNKSEAEKALRGSILAGRVSEKWDGEFPRFVWYRDDDDTIYEARCEVASPGRYHAYPIENRQVPRGVEW